MAATSRLVPALVVAAGLATGAVCGERASSVPVVPAEATLVLTATCDAGSDEPSTLAIALSLPLAGRPAGISPRRRRVRVV